jgi:Mor family transcriptional regulator
MDKDILYGILSVMPEEKRRNREIFDYNVKGLGARKLAKVYKITPQRVSQIIKAQRNKVSPGN